MTSKPPAPVIQCRREALSAAGASYKLEHLLAHAAEAASLELWRRLIEHLESEDFLVRHAEQPDGFETCARQLERYVLPAVVELRDWERFFQYLLIAANLRGLASTLDDPPILQALARSGRLDLAEALVNRLPQPTDRVQGWAVLAAILSPADPAFDRLVSALQAELEEIPERMVSGEEPVVSQWNKALALAGQLLAPQLRSRWSGWIARLAPRNNLADELRIAIAGGFFVGGDPEAPELWKLLAEVEDPELLRQFLPNWIADVGSAEPRRWLGILQDRLHRGATDTRLLWSVGLALLARRGSQVAANWTWLCGTLERPAWDRELLETGARLWPVLSDGAIEELAARLADPPLRCLLRVLVLEGRRNEDSFDAALAPVLELEPRAERLALYLRVLSAAPPALSREVERRTRALATYLAEIQFALPSSALRRSLDLVARHLSRDLPSVLDAAFAVPANGPETLRTLAEESEEEGLLRELFERAETYAAMAAANAAEGFELRRDLLILLGRRLTERNGDLLAFREAAERLLPQEEDRLRAEAARLLGAPQGPLTRELCDGIRDRRLQLQVRLETLGADADPGDLVAPLALYWAAARLDPMAEELRALAVLLWEPRHPARLAEEHVEGLSSLGRRVQALTDLAWHSLRYQMIRFRPDCQDRLAAILPLKQALGVVESDDWIVSLTPELVTIGGHLGSREAVAETQEAIEQVAGLESVPWVRREEALIDILVSFESLLLASGPSAPLGHEPQARRRRRAAELIGWVVECPERTGKSSAGQTLQRQWHRLLPLLTAIGERPQPPLALRRRLVPWATRLGPASVSVMEASAHKGWQWTPNHGEVFRYCLASADERIEQADRLIEGVGEHVDPEIARALAWLIGREAPTRVPSLLRLVDPGPERDQTVQELIRTGSLPSGVAQKLLSLQSPGGSSWQWGWIWLGLNHPSALPESEWLRAVAALVAQDSLDPEDPRTSAIRRRLWTLQHEALLPELAKAALGALSVGGQKGGERALRFFLNAYIQPRLGERASQEVWQRSARMWRALGRTASLVTERRPGDSDGDAAREDSAPAAPRSVGGCDLGTPSPEAWGREFIVSAQPAESWVSRSPRSSSPSSLPSK